MQNPGKHLLAAAVGGLLLASSVGATEPAPAGGEKTGQCHGINSCKGTSACHTAENSCAGKNSCKGKGWIKATKTDCEAKGGRFED